MERRRLAETFGTQLWGLRAWAGLTQRQLADRAGLAGSVLRDLEHGRARPSDATCRKLAAALHPRADDLTVAVADLELQHAAGRSLRPRNRRKPPRLRTQRLYERARRVLAEREAVRPRLEAAACDAALVLLDPDRRADPFEGGRRPAVRR